MTSASPRGERPQLFATLVDDIRIVVDDLMRRGVRRSVRGTLSALEQFYLSREERQRLAELRGFRRFIRRIGYFTRGLLMKLTPARRIMLAAAFLSLFLGMFNVTMESRHLTLRFQSQGTVLLLAVLVLELKDKLIARDELEAGRVVQLALMPTDQPQVPGWDVWLHTQPANDVGGDLVDHLALDDGQHAVVLGDVTGKALPAALLAVKLQATIRALAPNYSNLGDLGAGVNRILYRDGLPTRFASLIYAVLNPQSGEVRLLNAGHMPPIVMRDRTLTVMPRGSMVLGMMPNVPFSEQQETFVRGDLIVVYSDGVSEAMNEAEDFFGDERLHPLILETVGMSAADAGAHILARLSSFVGDAVQSDDVSLLILRRTAA